MKKILTITLTLVIILSSTNQSFASQTNYDTKGLTRNEYKLLKNYAIEQNKVLSQEKYDSIHKQYKDDLNALDNALKNYSVSTKYYYPQNHIASVRSGAHGDYIGQLRLREDTYYLLQQVTDSTWTCDYYSSNSADPADIFLGFLGLIPKGGVGFGILALFKALSLYENFTVENVKVQSLYDALLRRKILERWDGQIWEKRVMTDQRQCDGYLLCSGYQVGVNHFSNTVEVGKVRLDTGLLFYDHDRLFQLGNTIYHYKYDSGTTEYFKPQL